MASDQPFQPSVKSGSGGQTVTVVVSTTTQFLTQVNSTGGFNPSLLVVANGQTVGVPYVRMSVESSTTITASNTDIPFPLGSNATVRLFANPNPTGITNIAVVYTVAPTSLACNFYFTPGQGGIF